MCKGKLENNNCEAIDSIKSYSETCFYLPLFLTNNNENERCLFFEAQYDQVGKKLIIDQAFYKENNSLKNSEFKKEGLTFNILDYKVSAFKIEEKDFSYSSSSKGNINSLKITPNGNFEKELEETASNLISILDSSGTTSFLLSKNISPTELGLVSQKEEKCEKAILLNCSCELKDNLCSFSSCSLEKDFSSEIFPADDFCRLARKKNIPIIRDKAVFQPISQAIEKSVSQGSTLDLDPRDLQSITQLTSNKVSAKVVGAVSLASCEAGEWLDGSFCKPLTVCDSSQYETKASTSISDRTCSPLTVCDASEYEAKAATKTSDRECLAKSGSCPINSYESKAATSSSDRECSLLTLCESDEFISEAHTITSNRKCSSCPGGHSCDGEKKTACLVGSYASEGLGSCQSCEVGTYSSSSSASSCQECAAGMVVNAEQTSCKSCAAGSFAVASESTCSNKWFVQKTTKICDRSLCSTPSDSCIACDTDNVYTNKFSRNSFEIISFGSYKNKSHVHKIRYQFEAKEDGVGSTTEAKHKIRVERIKLDGSSYSPRKEEEFYIDSSARLNLLAQDTEFRLYQGEFTLNEDIEANEPLKLKIFLSPNEKVSFTNFEVKTYYREHTKKIDSNAKEVSPFLACEKGSFFDVRKRSCYSCTDPLLSLSKLQDGKTMAQSGIALSCYSCAAGNEANDSVCKSCQEGSYSSAVGSEVIRGVLVK